MKHIYVGEAPRHGDDMELVAVCGTKFEYGPDTAAENWSDVTCPNCLAEKNKPHFMAVGPYCWGRGATQDEALRNMRKANGGKVDRYAVYLCDRTTWIDGFGGSWCKNGGKTAVVVLDKSAKKPAKASA